MATTKRDAPQAKDAPREESAAAEALNPIAYPVPAEGGSYRRIGNTLERVEAPTEPAPRGEKE